MRFIEYYGSFAKYIDSITPEPFQRNSIKTPLGLNWRFRYLNPEIGFVRREKQFQLLDDFLDREDPFLSLAITGYGGIGKSRLLHQYKLELRSNTEWKALIADRSAIDRICSSNFTEWKYPKKLLLVFDYAGENTEQIGKWIQAVCNSTARPEKIRIVLLERQGLTSNNDQPIQPRWYQQMNKASGYSLEKIQYQYGNDPKENGFYELPRLSKDEMLQVMDKLPNSKRKLTTEEKEQIYEKIAGFAKDFNDERFNTPLIALLSTDAYLNGEALLNPEQLMSYVIERDKDSWKRALKGYPEPDKLVDALERTLVFATATGGCDITNKDFKSISPLAKEDANLLIDNLKKEGYISYRL